MAKSKKIVMTGGGTAGHVQNGTSPVSSIPQALPDKTPPR